MALDLIVRHQALVIISLGVIISVSLFLAALREIAWVRRFGVAISGLLFGTVSPRVSLPLVIALFMGLLAAVEPIPRTFGLEAVELDAMGNSLHFVSFIAPSYLVVFLHGWNGDSLATWQRFPDLVREDPKFQGVTVVSLPYPTYMVRRNLRVAELAQWLADELRRNGADRFEGVFFIAHSMGGVLAREIVVQHRLAAAPIRYRRLVEIGTPHEGANLAGLASVLGLSRELTEDLASDSGFLVGLRQHWNQLSARPTTFCITSPQDAVVDERSATAQCDREFRYPQWGHSDLVKPQDRNDARYQVPANGLLDRSPVP